MSQSPKPDSKRKQAVALKYQAGTMEAPKIVAKGKGYVAENMLKTAKENQIPVQEDPSLVEVVAEILAFVYRLDKGGKKSG
jgi:flagellar biosynthesis protein